MPEAGSTTTDVEAAGTARGTFLCVLIDTWPSSAPEESVARSVFVAVSNARPAGLGTVTRHSRVVLPSA